MISPNSSRDPIPGKGRSGGDLAPVGSPPRSDPVAELIDEATDYAYLTVAAVLALAIVVVIVLVTS